MINLGYIFYYKSFFKILILSKFLNTDFSDIFILQMKIFFNVSAFYHNNLFDINLPSLADVGDHVVVINSRHIAMREELWRTFTFSYHTGLV